jgi:arsenical pump membrane protein
MATACSLAVLAVLLLCIVRPPRGLPEVAFAAPAAGIVLVTGLERWSSAREVVRTLGPTLAFVAGVFVLAEVADAVGLFERAGHWLEPLARRGERPLVVGVALVALLTTTVLSLDATVVLFTPVVVRLVRGRRSSDAALLATVLLANGGSTLLPVANLTNLLVVQQTGLGYGSFFVRMAAPGLVAALLITWICARPVGSSPEGAEQPPIGPDHGHAVGLHASGRVEPAPLLRDPVALFVAIGMMTVLAGFLVTSAARVAPAWVACLGAAVLSAVAVIGRRLTVRRAAGATSPGFLAFVLGLAVVVDASARHGLAAWIDHRVPHGEGLLALLAVAGLATLLANLVNNLPATLLLLPALAGRPTPLLLAALLGLNVGPSLTYSGSLATLLWRKVVREAGVEPASRRYFATAWASTTAALPAAVFVLWLVTRVTG